MHPYFGGQPVLPSGPTPVQPPHPLLQEHLPNGQPLSASTLEHLGAVSHTTDTVAPPPHVTLATPSSHTLEGSVAGRAVLTPTSAQPSPQPLGLSQSGHNTPSHNASPGASPAAATAATVVTMETASCSSQSVAGSPGNGNVEQPQQVPTITTETEVAATPSPTTTTTATQQQQQQLQQQQVTPPPAKPEVSQ